MAIIDNITPGILYPHPADKKRNRVFNCTADVKSDKLAALRQSGVLHKSGVKPAKTSKSDHVVFTSNKWSEHRNRTVKVNKTNTIFHLHQYILQRRLTGVIKNQSGTVLRKYKRGKIVFTSQA